MKKKTSTINNSNNHSYNHNGVNEIVTNTVYEEDDDTGKVEKRDKSIN